MKPGNSGMGMSFTEDRNWAEPRAREKREWTRLVWDWTNTWL